MSSRSLVVVDKKVLLTLMTDMISCH